MLAARVVHHGDVRWNAEDVVAIVIVRRVAAPLKLSEVVYQGLALMHFAVGGGPREVHGLRSVRVVGVHELLALVLILLMQDLGPELVLVRCSRYRTRRGRTLYCLQVVLADFTALVLVMLSLEVATGFPPHLLLWAVGLAAVPCHELVQVLRRYRQTGHSVRLLVEVYWMEGDFPRMRSPLFRLPGLAR